MEYIIETHALVKRYGDKQAVNRVSMHVKRGDIYGLIGKNGAGKTSLMKLLLGLTSPNEGQITLLGRRELDRSRRKIGSLIEAPAFYKNETALENLKRFALLTPTPEEEIRGILRLVGLGDTGRKKAGAFSLGMKQRLGIAIALLGNPELLILDEPINGLDPSGIKEIRDIILELNGKGVTFLISSHLLDELGKIATSYGIVADGILVEEITAKELAEKCRTSWKVVVDNTAKAAAALRTWREDLKFDAAGNELHIFSETDSSQVNLVLFRAGVRIYETRSESIDLEDFFIERLGR